MSMIQFHKIETPQKVFVTNKENPLTKVVWIIISNIISAIIGVVVGIIVS